MSAQVTFGLLRRHSVININLSSARNSLVSKFEYMDKKPTFCDRHCEPAVTKYLKEYDGEAI